MANAKPLQMILDKVKAFTTCVNNLWMVLTFYTYYSIMLNINLDLYSTSIVPALRAEIIHNDKQWELFTTFTCSSIQ